MIIFLFGLLIAGIICLFGAFLLHLIIIDHHPQYYMLYQFFYIAAIVAIAISLFGLTFNYVGTVYLNWMYNLY